MREKFMKFLIWVIIIAALVAYNVGAWRIGYVGIWVKYDEPLFSVAFLGVAVAIEAFCLWWLLETDDEEGGMY